ncbi:GNAT family N-acetyltransferase [Streptomyces sp. NPDC092952]|uniref:GNAT family N-acetyltransferase n=1 Tax=Streptomyces sp. NPDC092952 TaxID=3366018 RepID=UPI0037FD46A1
MIILPARLEDVPRLVRFRVDAAAWLTPMGIDQWSAPFPAEHIAASVIAGEVFLVKENEESAAVATVTLDQNIDPEIWDLWTTEERAEPALYVHKLAVDRHYSGRGLGGQLLDWAGDRAARHGARWLRLDAWTSNTRLHQYYLQQGFRHVRTTADPDEVSGWLAQRPARPAEHGFDDRTAPALRPLPPLGDHHP